MTLKHELDTAVVGTHASLLNEIGMELRGIGELKLVVVGLSVCLVSVNDKCDLYEKY